MKSVENFNKFCYILICKYVIEKKFLFRPIVGPSSIGRNDLDPFGGSGAGGGMLYDPFSNRGTRPAFPGLGIPGRLPP